jgi:lipopolysaccharide transport system permease protein
MALGMARAIWNYRGFVMGSVKRDFQSRYRNSMLGATWAVINPLAMIVVYTVIFSQIMRARLPGVESGFGYGIYLCAGVLTWGLFAEITSRAQAVFLDNSNLIKKISFPRICLPFILVINAGLNFAIVFSLFLGFLVLSGNFPGIVALAALPVLAIQIAFSIGLGITLGVLNVFFRDVGQLFLVVLQFWFWLTPIVYPISIIPEEARPLIRWNPMSSLISAYQEIFAYGRWPQWEPLLYPLALAVLLCAAAMHLFRKHSGEIADEL